MEDNEIQYNNINDDVNRNNSFNSIHQIYLYQRYIIKQRKQKINKIRLIEHDGSLVPKLYNASEQLIAKLREQGAEILNENVINGEYIIYVQQYTQNEQNERDNCQGFHQGYTIQSFFQKHQDLIQYIDQDNLNDVSPFLDNDTYQLLSQQ